MANPDWYEKHEKDIGAALKKGRGAPQDHAVSCTLVRTKDGEFLICAHVTDNKAAAQVKEARQAGGRIISAGKLYAGPEGPTFEVDQGDLTIKAKFSAAAMGLLGAPMSVVVIGPPTPQPGQTAPSAPPAPDDMTAVRAALAKLVPTVQQVVKDHPEAKNDLLQPLARCQQHIKDNQVAEAKAVLIDVAKLVKTLAAAPPGNGQKPPPIPEETGDNQAEEQTPETTGAEQVEQETEETPTAPEPPPPAADMAAVRAALAKLLPAVKQAVTDHPEQKNELLQPLARCQQFIKDEQAAEAKAVLVEVARMVKTLASTPSGDGQAPQEVPEQPGEIQAEQKPKETAGEQSEQETEEQGKQETAEKPSEPDEYQELYNGLLETIPGDLRRLRESNPDAADKIQKVVDGATAHAGKGDFQKAFDYLNRAAEVLAKAAGAGRVQEAAETIPEGKVEAMKAALTQAQSKWDAAMKTARDRLKPVQAALQEEFPSEAAGLKGILDSYEQELLNDLLAGQAAADADGLAAAIRGTLVRVQSLRQEAAGDDLFSYLEQCGVPVKAAFAEAFDDVTNLLQA